ncbi:hypothetical protein AURDEDRAFT_112178 [Auricularia subglabra TFB-10046 SS5]|nr:hypothetical protein AURDEDRAFT_112178 [Auricularia subglabra TFB-10046 SS5]
MKYSFLPALGLLLLAHEAAALAQAAHTPAKRQLSRGRHALAARARSQNELRGLLDTLTDLLGGDDDSTSSSSSDSSSLTTETTGPSSSPTAITDPPPTSFSTTETSTSASSTSTSDPCDEGLLGGIIGIIGGCSSSTTSPATTTVTPTVVPPQSSSTTVSPTQSGSGTGSAPDSGTVEPTATGSGSVSTTAAPTSAPETTTTAAPTSTEACTPLVLLGLTISECEPSSTSTPGASTTASGSDPVTTTAPPESGSGSGTSVPTTTTTDPATSTDPCKPVVLLGATILPCEPSTTSDPATTTTTGGGGSEEPTTTPGPTTGPSTTGTGSDSSTSTSTPSDPCDPGLLGLLGILPASCTQTSTSTTVTGTGGNSGTDGPTTTATDGPTTTDTTSGSVTETGTDTVTTTTTNTLDPNPTDIFPGDNSTDTSATFTSSSTISTPTDLPTVTIPIFVTQTSELLIETDLPTTATIQPSNTDPDAVETSTPIAQSSSPQPTKQTLPNNLPSYIMAATAPQSQPSGYTLVTLMLSQRLNWDWVASNSQTALQIITFAPLTVVNALRIQQENVIMLALEAFIPENWNRDPKSLLTLVEMYIPDTHVDELAQQLRARNSAFYTQQANQVEHMLVAEVDPSYPLTAGGGGAASGGNSPLNPLVNGDESNGKDDARKRAIIGVCAAIGGAVALALAWWFYKYMQRSREMRHRRLSQNSDTNLGAAAMAGGAYGATGMMEERGRRDSFFFAADSLRGYEDGGMAGGMAAARYEDDTYDHRAGVPAGGARSPQQGPIVPSHISAPILRENTLNW